jgi:hypothetical protein
MIYDYVVNQIEVPSVFGGGSATLIINGGWPRFSGVTQPPLK